MLYKIEKLYKIQRKLSIWIILIASLLVYLFSLMFPDGFLNNFFSNLLATLLGVIIGIPVAFYMAGREEKKRATKILNLIRDELKHNLDAWDHFHVDVANGYNPLKEELWRAFSDGGELQWINDPELLDAISTAYFEINQIKFLYEKYYDAYYYPTRHPSNTIFNSMMDRVRKGKSKLTESLDKIDNILESIKNN